MAEGGWEGGKNNNEGTSWLLQAWMQRVFKKKQTHFSPSVELNPIGKFGELVREAPLLYDALWADRHLAQGVGLGGGDEVELVDGVGHHILGGGVLADDDVAALLVSLEHPDHLVWDV